MTIVENIKSSLIDSMRKRDEVRTLVLRSVIAGFTNDLVARGKSSNDPLSDAEAITVIRKQVKQRKDSIEAFTKGDRNDLVKKETAELTILEAFLPKSASSAEILKIAKEKKSALKITDKAKSGILVGAVIKELKGNADGNEVKKIVEVLLS